MYEALFWLSSAAIIHHHVTYPLSLGVMGKSRPAHRQGAELPPVTIIVPAYQEAGVIAAKVRNLAAIDYPRERISIEIHCDGCTDGTADAARAQVDAEGASSFITIIEHRENRGKIELLNLAITAASAQLVALTDASASFAPDAIRRLAAHFADARMAAAGGVYDCEDNGNDSEKRYWRFQNRLRLGEAALDSAVGLSGALYLFRRDLFTPLKPGTINDDFVLPMRMALAGKRVALDPGVSVMELERTAPGQEFERRIRIGAGNFQQMLLLGGLLNPARPGLAYCFGSGKVLRALMPFILVLAFFANMAIAGQSTFYKLVFSSQALIYVAAAITLLMSPENRRTPFAQLAAMVAGHGATGIGAIRYLFGRFSGKWARAGRSSTARDLYGSPVVRIAKRVFDVVGGLALFGIFAIAFVPLALAIKLDSRGPIFYRQLRVGRQLSDRTDLFHLIKFRTMRTDAEAKGASWATKADPRVTRLGRFMRKTRLDELPQAINVLKGEMSMIGPRPERPQFFAKLEGNIPLYIERTYGILPGITGLAQVKQGYDETIEDVRNKVGWDHAYAARINSFWPWLTTDLAIAWETVVVMVRGRGQ